MQQGDGGGLRYAMQAMQVLRERGQPPVSKTFCGVSICLLWRIWQRIRPTTTRTACRYTDADLLRCVSELSVARQDWTNELLASVHTLPHIPHIPHIPFYTASSSLFTPSPHLPARANYLALCWWRAWGGAWLVLGLCCGAVD